jgi:hypothetical protein
MGGWAEKLTIRAGGALAVLVAATAGAVLAASPGTESGPQDPGGTAGRTIRFEGWVKSAASADATNARLAVVTVNSTFEVIVDSGTTLLSYPGRQPLPPSELMAGLPVDVQGETTEDALIRATTMTVGALPATTAAADLSLRGRILAVFGPSKATEQRQLMVMTTSRGEYVLEVDADTAIVDAEDNRRSFEDLKAGYSVAVEARGTTQAVARALRIEISRKLGPPQLSVDGMLVARAELRPRERWIVGEVLVWVPASVVAVGRQPALGSQVSLQAERNAEGDLEAVRFRPQEAAARPQIVELRGKVEKLGDGELLVDGHLIGLPSDFSPADDVVVGAFVRVKASLDGDGRMTLLTVEVMNTGRVEVQFEGRIDAIPVWNALWTVAGIRVILNNVVVTGDLPVVGGHAEISGWQRPNGDVEATRIHVVATVQPTSLPLEGRLTAVQPPPAIWRVLAEPSKVEVEVVVSQTTIIQEDTGVARVGSFVRVFGSRNADNQVEATRIRVRGFAK